MSWDVIVIGAGLVGSAAARHLAGVGADVAVVGPAEPENAQSAAVFASHYDQGRVQRLIGFDELWTRLSVESAAAWPELERLTGMTVHDPVGCLYLAHHRDSYLREAPGIAAQFGLQHRMIDGAAAAAAIAPQMCVPDGVVGLFESGPAGSLNPRAVVSAQLRAAEQAGGTVFRDVVTALRRERGITEVTTASGEVHRAGKVVVATGSFTDASALLGRRPYLGPLGDGVVVAMGCNGYSAMASDAQGRIAASVALRGEVPAGYDAAELAVRTIAD